jgi:hypothetical protein
VCGSPRATAQFTRRGPQIRKCVLDVIGIVTRSVGVRHRLERQEVAGALRVVAVDLGEGVYRDGQGCSRSPCLRVGRSSVGVPECQDVSDAVSGEWQRCWTEVAVEIRAPGMLHL